MFTRARLRKLKHKTKKSMMLRIRRTESQPEDPKFKHFLATLREIKAELRDIYNKARRVAEAGKKYHKYLEKLGGFGFSSEYVFSKEVEFVNKLEDLVCAALGRIVHKDIKRLNELVLRYKKAKLRFEAVHFKTVKSMRRRGIRVAGNNPDEIMQVNADVAALHGAYVASKYKLCWWRDMIISNLRSTIGTRIAELQEVSDAEHHQLYCRYFERRLRKTLEFCSDEIVDKNVSKLDRRSTFCYRHKRMDTAGNLVRSLTAELGLGFKSDYHTRRETNASRSIVTGTPQGELDEEAADSISDKLQFSSETKDRTYSSGEEYTNESLSKYNSEDHVNSRFVSKMLSIISLPGQNYH